MPALIAPGDNSSWGRTLHSAYLGWCEARGIVPQLSDTAFNATRSKVWQVTRELLTKPPRPDAIVSAPDGAALGVLDAARERGLRVGHDLLVAACVDSTPFEFVQPSITALDQHPRDLGGHCAEALLRHLAGRPGTGNRRAPSHRPGGTGVDGGRHQRPLNATRAAGRAAAVARGIRAPAVGFTRRVRA